MLYVRGRTTLRCPIRSGRARGWTWGLACLFLVTRPLPVFAADPTPGAHGSEFGNVPPSAVAGTADTQRPLVTLEPAPPSDRAATVVQVLGGALLGTAIGGAWVLHDRSRRSAEDRWSTGTVGLLLAGGAATGAAIGGVAAHLRRPSLGHATFTPAASLLFATAAGLTAAALTGADDRRAANGYLVAAIGLEVGVVAASQAARALSPAVEDVVWMLVGALASATVLAAVVSASDGFSHPTAHPGVQMAAAGGLVIGGISGFGWSRARRTQAARQTHHHAILRK